MSKLVRSIRLNNLEYNVNRDPQIYRRLINQEFRLTVMLDGSGEAQVSFFVDGKNEQQKFQLPGKFDYRFSFGSEGSRTGIVQIQKDNEKLEYTLRLDTLEEHWRV
ncbi:MAG: hypothetical protein OEZ43_08610 [Gammaproteobacteria bacterium]|nr:hypothetical protein [Gammaproteobacteria bacterium]